MERNRARSGSYSMHARRLSDILTPPQTVGSPVNAQPVAGTSLQAANGTSGNPLSGLSSAATSQAALDSSDCDDSSSAVSVSGYSATGVAPNSAPPTPMQLDSITLSDLVSESQLETVDSTASVETAFEYLESHGLSCLPVRDENGEIYTVFDHTDLTGYLLLVTGHLEGTREDKPFVEEMENAKRGIATSVKFAAELGVKDPFVVVPVNSLLVNAIRQFANGVHRIAAINDKKQVVGLLSQRRMLTYIWNNIRRFPSVDQALNKTLEELHIGTYKTVLSIPGDAPTIEAFAKLHENAISSLAVTNQEGNIIGNISVADVALVTHSRNASLLQQPVKNYLATVLDNRGLQDGKDSVPVFFVDPSSTLRFVLAKLVATKAHRLWIVEPHSDSAASGKLTGVISLTDVFNLLARLSGYTLDPDTARRQRRSSSSSTRSSSQVRRQLFSHGPPQSPSNQD